MTVLMVTVLLASLFGSLHCAGMCGAFVLFAIGAGDLRSHKARARLMAAYHAGRLTTYMALGGLAGLLGSAINLAGARIGLERVAAVLAGTLMIVYGVATLLRLSGMQIRRLPVPRMLEKLLIAGHGLAQGLTPVARAAITGLLTTLLPCGWLYAFVIVAAGTGSSIAGVSVMAAFWVGTLPILTALGLGVDRLGRTLARRVPVFTAICVSAAGLYTVVARAQIVVPAGQVHSTDRAALVQDVRAISQKELPCCTRPAETGECRTVTVASDLIFTAADQAVVACDHCGLPVPAGLVDPVAESQFCCNGCRTVFAVIHSCKMEKYYDLLRRTGDVGAASGPAHYTGRVYKEFDDSGFLALNAPLAGKGAEATRTIEFYLEGVHCGACVWLVEKLPSVIRGILEARLDLGKSLVRVTWLDHRTTASAVARMLDSLGYAPHPARSSSQRQIRTLDDRHQLVRIGVAGAGAGNVMLLATALYAGLIATMDPLHTQIFRVLSMVIGVIVLAWPGSVFFRGAWAAIKTRTPHLDLPIALALGAGGLAGIINTLTNTGEIYFDSLCVLVFLLLVGRFLQHRRQGIAGDALEFLFSLTPMSARRVVADGSVADVPIAALQLNETVEVRAGESIPVDGEILSGQSTLDESLLTGESLPKSVCLGDPVHAGTTNISSPVRIRVLATGEATRVAKLMHLVNESARRKAPIVLFADRIAGWFFALVLLIAGASFAWGRILGDAHALDHAVAVLIVACPCALGLATPLAVTVAIGRAARRGILIKGGETLERLAKPGFLLLDKTGTLTAGAISLQCWQGDESVKPLVAAIESQATHPMARAFNKAFADLPSIPRATEVSQEMRGGRRVLVGSPAFIAERCGPLTHEWNNEISACIARALTPVIVAVDGRVRALAGFGDTLRPDAKAALDALRAQGWDLGILSGDHPEIVRHIAEALDIAPETAHGAMAPEQKLNYVQDAMKRGTVVMVGDGVNDAAALAAASVGIAVHGGAEASLAAASIYLRHPGLGPVLEAVQASHGVLRVIRRAMAASLTYNCFTVTLAAVGWINPLVAAILMPISSLTVLSLALGTRTF